MSRAIRTIERRAPAPDDLVGVGNALRRLRAERGWTQDELARRAMISSCVVSRLENYRDVRASSLLAVADALDISLDVVCGWEVP